MSLRLRLVVAVGIVVIAALGIADVATYSAFRSYLNGQLDVTLQEASEPVQLCLDQGGRLTASLIEESTPGIFAETRSASGVVVSHVPAADDEQHVGTLRAEPDIPRRIGGVGALSRPPRPRGPMSDDCRDTLGPRADGLQAVSVRAREVDTSSIAPEGATDGRGGLYFTTVAAGVRRPAYRIRVSLLSDGDLLLLGIPVTQTGDSLWHLLVIELLVSAAALAVALLLGVILVRVGVKPLVDVEQTAEQIMEGDLQARVPERFGSGTEIGRLTRVLNSMLARLSDDLREREANEAALTRSEARMREFLADASHELRTPIAAVSAYAQLFAEGAQSRPEDLARVLKGIETETARMGRLVSDLMLLASLDEGRPIEMHPVELVSICADAVHAARAVGAEWPLELVAAEPVEVLGDATRLRQVVDNLLSNVRVHTPAGTTASVTVTRSGAVALIEVADHGPGLEGEARERVFERFFREDASRTRASGGAGLGLAIVRAIAEAHGGSVQMTKTPGGGATFSVRLPGVSS